MLLMPWTTLGRWQSPARILLFVALAACLGGGSGIAYAITAPSSADSSSGAVGSSSAGPAPSFRAVDADGHNVVLNRLGKITVVIGTNEDSQDAARAAGRAMYPFQGRSDFRLVIVADLRDSIASWVPSMVIARMRVSLDHEAIELKPYFLKNGNNTDPRKSSCVIPDFSGTICPQLGWDKPSDHLRGILFGPDGRELERWDDLSDMNVLQAEVSKALHHP
jgi:hypothetical protein